MTTPQGTDPNGGPSGERLDRLVARIAAQVAEHADRLADLDRRIDAIAGIIDRMAEQIVTRRLLVEAHPGGPSVELAAVDNPTEGRFAGVLVDSGDVEQRSVQLFAGTGVAPAVDLRNGDDVLVLQPHPEPRLRLLRRPRDES